MESKKCCKCKEVKHIEFFCKHKGKKDGYDTMCKACHKQWRKENKERIAERNKQYYQENKERNKQWRKENKERIAERHKQWRKENKERIAEHRKQYREENKERIKQYREENKERLSERKKQYYQENKERIAERTKQYHQENKERRKQYRQENKERIAEYRKQYLEENKERLKQYREENKERLKQYREENRERKNERHKQRKITDPLYKLTCNLRARTYKAFQYKSYRKTSKTAEMLGVPYEIAFAHIERQFTKGMTWENQGEWHIDHIIPLASAETESELIKLCHYTNLQPLWAFDNISKSDNLIDGTQVKLRL